MNLLIATCLLGSLITSGCASSPKAGGGPSPTTEFQIHDVQKSANSTLKFINKALDLLDAAQAGKISISMAVSQIHEQLVQAAAAGTDTVETLPETLKAAAADRERIAKLEAGQAEQQKKIAALEANRNTIDRLQWGAVGWASLGALLVTAGLIWNLKPCKIAGACAAGMAVVFLVMARLIIALNRVPDWMWLALSGAGLIAVGVYLWLHFHVKQAKAADDAKYVPIPAPLVSVPPTPLVTSPEALASLKGT